MDDTTIYLLAGLAPAFIGAILAFLNSTPVNAFVDRTVTWMNGKLSSAGANGGKLNNFIVAPFLFSVLKLASFANAIQHGGLRRGAMVMATLYVVEAFVLLAYIAVSIMIAVAIIALAFLVVGFIFSQMGKNDNNSVEKDYSSMMGPRGSRSTNSFLGVELPNGTRVNESGQIMKVGMFVDTPTGMKIDKDGRLVKEGLFVDTPTGTKMDKDGRIVEEGLFVDTPTGKRIDKDGNVIEEGWLFDTKTGTRHVK